MRLYYEMFLNALFYGEVSKIRIQIAAVLHKDNGYRKGSATLTL